jgi:hypothetical protein
MDWVSLWFIRPDFHYSPACRFRFSRASFFLPEMLHILFYYIIRYARITVLPRIGSCYSEYYNFYNFYYFWKFSEFYGTFWTFLRFIYFFVKLQKNQTRVHSLFRIYKLSLSSSVLTRESFIREIQYELGQNFLVLDRPNPDRLIRTHHWPVTHLYPWPKGLDWTGCLQVSLHQ